MTRPLGEVSYALLNAAAELATPGHGGTMRELAARACVGLSVAGYMVPKLAGAGHLEKIADRRVEYRTRPVAEYTPRGNAPPAFNAPCKRPCNAPPPTALPGVATFKKTTLDDNRPAGQDAAAWANFV